MVGCVEGICGIRPDADGVTISPSVPSEWDGFKMEKIFRGKSFVSMLIIRSHTEWRKGSRSERQKLDSAYVPAKLLSASNNITVVMG